MKKIIAIVGVIVLVVLGIRLAFASATTTTTLKLPCTYSNVRVTVGSAAQASYACSGGFIEIKVDTTLYDASPFQ